MRQRVVYIDIVHIKCVFRQFELAEFEHLRAVDDRVHQDILIQAETSDIVPAEDLILRKYVVIADHFLVLHADFFIHVVGDDHIDPGVCIYKPFDRIENLYKRILIYPVVTVYYFKIFSGGVLQTAVDSVTVSAILLADGFYDCRIFFLIALSYFLRSVYRPVVDYENFNIFPSADEDGVDGLFHICFRIIAWYSE